MAVCFQLSARELSLLWITFIIVGLGSLELLTTLISKVLNKPWKQRMRERVQRQLLKRAVHAINRYDGIQLGSEIGKGDALAPDVTNGAPDRVTRLLHGVKGGRGVISICLFPFKLRT